MYMGTGEGERKRECTSFVRGDGEVQYSVMYARNEGKVFLDDR